MALYQHAIFGDISPMLRRLILLYVGLVLYGLSSAMMVRAGLGLDPWNALHEGISLRLNVSFGTVIIGVGALLMLLWIPLRQRPGIGTISNVVLIGLAADAALMFLAQPASLAVRVAMLIAAIILNGIASGMYIGAGLGPGPRDGLMTGLAARSGWSIRLTRTGIEISVLVLGWLLGGTIGIGTIFYALAIGVIIDVTLPMFQAMARDPARASFRA
ncbi:membrane protein YczE [Sphingopyxis sp. MSC1_008]|uniref:membrane protein YczE n=1 Tax=Sphingopyxis sp. MSC1_008 TaxID=2909265 RepID=UPI0032BFE747